MSEEGPSAGEIMAEVATDMLDNAALHKAILARRDWHDQASQILTRWAELVRAREVEATSQRKAAATLGVSRGAVRGKAK